MNSVKYIDVEIEQEKIRSLNMTVRLHERGDPYTSLSNLVRAFHLNTIVSRIFFPWLSLLARDEYAKKRYKMFGSFERIEAAYVLFKDEILTAISCLPEKNAIDINTGTLVSTIFPLLEAFPETESFECDNLILHLRNAYDIHDAIFGHQPSMAQNFENFLQIARDEYYTYGVLAPGLGEEASRPISKDIEQELSDEARRYHQLLYRDIYCFGDEP